VPIQLNDAPVASIDVPIQLNDAPVASIDVPIQLNDAPVASTDVPMQVKGASLTSTDVPMQLRGASLTSIDASLPPLRAPKAPTRSVRKRNPERSATKVARDDLDGAVVRFGDAACDGETESRASGGAPA
jgi:hypothetical protein